MGKWLTPSWGYCPYYDYIRGGGEHVAHISIHCQPHHNFMELQVINWNYTHHTLHAFQFFNNPTCVINGLGIYKIYFFHFLFAYTF